MAGQKNVLKPRTELKPEVRDRLKSLVLRLKAPLTDELLCASRTAVSTLASNRAVKELKHLGLHDSDPVAIQAISALENLKAVEELRYLGENASDPVAKQAVSALENLKAVGELQYLGRWASEPVAKQAREAFERLSTPTEEIISEIKELCDRINKQE